MTLLQKAKPHKDAEISVVWKNGTSQWRVQGVMVTTIHDPQRYEEFCRRRDRQSQPEYYYSGNLGCRNPNKELVP